MCGGTIWEGRRELVCPVSEGPHFLIDQFQQIANGSMNVNLVPEGSSGKQAAAENAFLDRKIPHCDIWVEMALDCFQEQAIDSTLVIIEFHGLAN